MDLYHKLINKKEKISIIGLGYVGLQLALAFAQKIDVIGFDIDFLKIEKYRRGIDITHEVGKEALNETSTIFTADESSLSEAMFHIIAVPTPITNDKKPNLKPIIDATKIVARNLRRESFVIYESTVYPGVTEEVCLPLLEKESGLSCPKDFKIGYSPERINPGDKIHRLENTVKIVSGIDEEALNVIAKVYELVTDAGVYKAETIRIAEAAKLVENCQRDINIAFMNEIAMLFHQLNIDTKAVLNAAQTKWNFSDFTPGLVGGHCVGVDPYYLIYKAEEIGYNSKIIKCAREVNTDIIRYVTENIIYFLNKAGKKIKNSKIAFLGITFKENVADLRNSKVLEIIKNLESLGAQIMVVDYLVDPTELWGKYQFKVNQLSDVRDVDILVLAVPHQHFRSLQLKDIKKMCAKRNSIFFDLKSVFNKKDVEKIGLSYWNL